MSRAAEARIVARAGAPQTPRAAPEKPGPFAVIRQLFDDVFDRVDRLEAAAQTRATRAILSHRIEADGRLVVTLPGGSEEIVGYLAKGAAE